jgi:hypothetical protein
MKNLITDSGKPSVWEKILLYLTVLSGSLWLGSYMLRLFLSYRLFQEKNFVLKSFVTNQNLSGILTALLPAFMTTLILYIIFIICFILYLLICRPKIKENGWLFISSVLIFVTCPFEVYLMTYDYKIAASIYSGSFDPQAILKLIIERFTSLSSFPVIEIISYFAVIFFVLFQPLKMKKKIIDEN